MTSVPDTRSRVAMALSVDGFQSSGSITSTANYIRAISLAIAFYECAASLSRVFPSFLTARRSRSYFLTLPAEYRFYKSQRSWKLSPGCILFIAIRSVAPLRPPHVSRVPHTTSTRAPQVLEHRRPPREQHRLLCRLFRSRGMSTLLHRRAGLQRCGILLIIRMKVLPPRALYGAAAGGERLSLFAWFGRKR